MHGRLAVYDVDQHLNGTPSEYRATCCHGSPNPFRAAVRIAPGGSWTNEVRIGNQ